MAATSQEAAADLGQDLSLVVLGQGELGIGDDATVDGGLIPF
ncbi:hypothetical protein FRUB_06526 [Fimbriiglobus ruber]|uniref:Uncharacterized protein n=2 Tax=Fimbriiglobus ruber TaxID=1908690 RepID=A0A225DIV8_9BACT|nr:hypothetical protein FRUB_06526 [Fimbriiglobus ruber]